MNQLPRSTRGDTPIKEIRSLPALGMACHSGESAAKRKLALSIAKGICFWLPPKAALWIVLALAAPRLSRAQVPYLQDVGSPSFATAEAVPLGYINLANGNKHLEIPIASQPQRGSLPYVGKFVYDSRIWKIVNNGSSQSWQPTNVQGSIPNQTIYGGWRFIPTSQGGSTSYTTTTVTCSGSNTYYKYSNFWWYSPDGTRHLFYITTQQDVSCGVQNISSGDALAQDSSGFHMYVTNYTVSTVYGHDGSIVLDQTQSGYNVKDPNGNYYSGGSSTNVVDTLGRRPVTPTASGNSIYYDVLDSQDTTNRYTVTTETINVHTAFGQSGVTEYSGTITVFQSIALPDGTSYQFTYGAGTAPGNYGQLISMTLPTGGQVQYGYTNFSDVYGNVQRWLSSRTSGGGTWTYTPAVISTCSPSQVGCQQKVTEVKPSGDNIIYTFTVNNGAWNTETDFYTGSSTLLRTVTQDYDFSNACPGCVGAEYIRRTRVTTNDVTVGSSTITKKTEYSYDSPANGNITEVRDWKYYSGTAPATADRITDTTYVTSSAYVNKNMISLPTSVVTKTGGGTKMMETDTSYDGTSLTSVTGIVNHDDTSYGTPRPLPAVHLQQLDQSDHQFQLYLRRGRQPDAKRHRYGDAYLPVGRRGSDELGGQWDDSKLHVQRPGAAGGKELGRDVHGVRVRYLRRADRGEQPHELDG